MSGQQFLALQSFFRRHTSISKVVGFFAFYSIFLFAMAMVYLLVNIQTRGLFLLALVAFVFNRAVLCNIIYLVYKRKRPYQQYSFNPLSSNWFSSLTTKATSFPSRHTLSLASLSTIFLLLSIPVGLATMTITLLTGAARVVFGFHYISDVLAGFFLGIAGSAFIYYFFGRLILGLY
jgi:membrane-associated phospholipid phosphatase